MSRETIWKIIGFVSWPALVLVLYLISKKPPAGVRWADANPDAGALLAATGMLWMTCLLLYVIWKLVFNVIFPAIEKARNK